jgi:PIN domain nuclease of toxin-antitoxin system
MVVFDSHIIVWMLLEPHRLRPETFKRLRLRRERVAVSMATVWELEIKRGQGKLDLGNFDWNAAIRDETIEVIDITLEDTLRTARLPLLHRDPFDRMIIAQALNRNAVVVTRDEIFKDYGVSMLMG